MGCLQLIQYTTEFNGKTIKRDICTSQEDNKTLQENIQRDVYNSQIIQPDGIYGGSPIQRQDCQRLAADGKSSGRLRLNQ